MHAQPTETIRAFLGAVRKEDEAQAKALSAAWDTPDGGARLFRQFGRRGTKGLEVGEARVRDARALVPLHRDERTVWILLTSDQGAGWRILGAHTSEGLVQRWLDGKIPFPVVVDALPPAPEDAQRAEAELARALVEKAGQVDGAPFNLRLMLANGATMDPSPSAHHLLDDRALFHHTRTTADGETRDLWLILIREDGGWKLEKAVEHLDPSALLADDG